MNRLLDYLQKLGLMCGDREHIHLVDVTEGSLTPVIGVEEEEYEKVKSSIRDAASNRTKPFEDLMELLQKNGHRAELFGEGSEELIQDYSPVEQQTFGPFWQQGILYGYLTRLEGRDRTDHATLVYDGGQCICEMTQTIARDLAPHYRSTVRIYGQGRWYRNADGKWELLRFVADRFESLDDTTLFEVVKKLRAVPNNGLVKLDDPIGEMQRIRDGEH
jgi:hypothetical protein